EPAGSGLRAQTSATAGSCGHACWRRGPDPSAGTAGQHQGHLSTAMVRLKRAASALLATSLLAAVGYGSASATIDPLQRAKALAPLTLGFSGGADPALASGSASAQARWVPRAEAEGTQIVRLDVYWNQVA